MAVRTTGLSSASTIVYDEVLTNIGQDYDVLTGHFRASVAGYYQFFFSAKSTGGKAVGIRLLIDTKSISSAYDVVSNSQFSNSAIIWLSVGDSAYTGMFNTGAISSGATFSGSLLVV